MRPEVNDEQTEYLKNHFELFEYDGTDEYYLKHKGKLAKMTTIGQILVGDDQVIEEES